MRRRPPLFAASISAALAACGGEAPVTAPVTTPLRIETASLPMGQEGIEYAAQVVAFGDVPAQVRWQIVGQLPRGLYLSNAGEAVEGGVRTTVLGTPREGGEFPFEVQLVGAGGAFIDAQVFLLSVTPDAPGLEVITVRLPDGATGRVYDAQLLAEHGAPPYRWRVADGRLPEGLELTEAGRLSGVPTRPGAFMVSLVVQDSLQDEVAVAFELSIQDTSQPLEMITATLPDGEVGLSYSAFLRAKNGAGDYRWRFVGDEPPGLRIETADDVTRLLGTPTAQGSYVFALEVTDAWGSTLRRTFFVDVAAPPPPVRIVTTALPGGTVGFPYDAPITARNGGYDGYRWAVVSGRLPPGLVLDDSGAPSTHLRGTPAQSGSFDFTVEVSDGRTGRHQVSFRVSVLDQTFPLEITTTSSTTRTAPSPVHLPNAQEGVAYSTQITARNGSGSYHWVVTEGNLPAGLTLDVPGTPSTTISGTPLESGVFVVRITVYDSTNETASAWFSLTVAEP